MRFRVQLDMFAGPLDLLWYLVRKQELDILDIPIARVTEQYLEMLTVLEVIDVNAVGDFLELATRLMEIKSRLMLPRHEEDREAEEQVEDPRHDIVQRLLEYKKYKDAASMLAERGRLWQQRFARRASDIPVASIEPVGETIHEVELWDLVSAFARVMRDNAANQPSQIYYDDTPIEVYIEQIRVRLASESPLPFTSLFQPGMVRSQMIGIFLAVLELIRHHHVQVEQPELFGEIWIAVSSSGDLESEEAGQAA